jgi:primosomal protein N' (replication factor Y) (superfamily II helicase)
MSQLSFSGLLPEPSPKSSGVRETELPPIEGLPPTQYAQVLVDLDTKSLDRRTFTYSIPPEFADLIDIGLPVQVPFGHMKDITGYVVGFTSEVKPGIRVRPVTTVLDDEPLFDLAYLQFLDWIANYTVTPLMTVLSAALPPAMLRKTNRKVALVEGVAYALNLPRLSAPERVVIEHLMTKSEAISVSSLQHATKMTPKKLNQTLAKLRRRQFIQTTTEVADGVKEKTITVVALALPPDELPPLTSRQRELWQQLQLLLAEGPRSVVSIQHACKTTPATLKKLAELQLICFDTEVVHRDRSWFQNNDVSNVLNRLTPEQASATEKIREADPETTWLLYGVTGSGKTEVYLALTHAALSDNKSVLVLLPEITLTSHIARRFVDAFGPDQVVLWHSQLTQSEKVDAWKRIQNGDLKIIIGARSAIFTPVQNLAYVFMDEEHETSFKQETPAPRYHAKTLAEKLIALRGAKLVLGSATPDVYSYYRALQTGHLVTLPGRFANRPMAQVDIIDLAKEREFGLRQNLSPKLIDKLKETLDKKQQAILLLNRRGFHTYIQCESCKSVYECPNCAVSLTWHQTRGVVRCHYCGHDGEKPRFCIQCGSTHLSFTGMGTQRLEAELELALPEARVLRLDGDVMQAKSKYREILDAFRKHEADILVGTQMIAKGLDIANVTMVGVVGADMMLNMPDYRAGERAFQILTQVAGRAGRGELLGEVLIQTWQADNPLFTHILAQDYAGFYADEIARRAEWQFPPYSQLFRIIVSSENDSQAKHFIEALTFNWKSALSGQRYAEQVETLGPAPCLIPRVQNRWRYHLLIRNQAGEVVHRLLGHFFRNIKPPDGLTCILDVDAQSLF